MAMPDDLTKIPAEEGYDIEFKSFSGGISTKELASSLCAFANTDGGSIFLGVTDSRELIGLVVTPGVLDQVLNAAREYCSPPIPVTLERIPLGVGNREILQIKLERSPRLHSLITGDTMIRVGTQDKRLIGDELLRLAETKSQVSFEETELDAGLEILDQVSIEEYYRARRKVSSISPQLSSSELLTKIGLATASGDRLRTKAGAFLLFGKPDSDFLLQREFTFLRYDGTTTLYQFREDVRLPARLMVERLLELIRPFNQVDTVIEGAKRRTITRFPEEALREAILNAIAHRNYGMAGLRNECRLYPDRIEVTSPGGLPSMVSLRTLGHVHYSRNPKITHALMILGLVEEIGQGITLMRQALANNGNPSPEFYNDDERFRVVFRAPQAGHSSGEDSRAQDATRITAENNSLESLTRAIRAAFPERDRLFTRGEVESVLGVRTTQAKSIIKKLLGANAITRIGAGPTTRYRIR